MATNTNAFTQAYRTTCIPKYNTETLMAIQEARDIRAGKIKTKRYDTAEEMEADLDAENNEALIVAQKSAEFSSQ
jgi:hypothetical protein